MKVVPLYYSPEGIKARAAAEFEGFLRMRAEGRDPFPHLPLPTYNDLLAKEMEAAAKAARVSKSVERLRARVEAMSMTERERRRVDLKLEKLQNGMGSGPVGRERLEEIAECKATLAMAAS